MLGDAIGPFRARYPALQLRLIEGFLPTLEAGLLDGSVDLYVGPVHAPWRRDALSAETLADNRRVVVGRRGHPLAGARRLADLVGAQWLTTSVTHEAEDELHALFAEHALPAPDLVCRCQSALSISTVLTGSDVLAMLPVQWTRSAPLAGFLQAMALRETLPAPPIMLVHRRGLGLTPAGEAFADLARTLFSR